MRGMDNERRGGGGGTDKNEFTRAFLGMVSYSTEGFIYGLELLQYKNVNLGD